MRRPGRCGQPPHGVQVQPVVVTAPAGADAIGALDHDRLDAARRRAWPRRSGPRARRRRRSHRWTLTAATLCGMRMPSLRPLNWRFRRGTVKRNGAAVHRCSGRAGDDVRRGGSRRADATAELGQSARQRGVQAVVIAGTTGEGMYLDAGDRRELLAAVRAAVPRSLPVIVGTGDAVADIRSSSRATPSTAARPASSSILPRTSSPRRSSHASARPPASCR